MHNDSLKVEESGVRRGRGEESSAGLSNWMDIVYGEEEYTQGLPESSVPGEIVLARKGTERFDLGALADDRFLWDLLSLKW